MGSEKKTKIVIAEDYKLIREGIRLILKEEPGFEVVGEAVNGLQAIDVVAEFRPDVLLLDLTLPEMDGIQAIPTIRNKSPATKILMLTATIDEETVLRALTAGANGYLSKNTDSTSLIKAIKVVLGGELWVERKLIARAFQNGLVNHSADLQSPKDTDGLLTPREKEVLAHLTGGATNKEIAGNLYISEKTVKSHLNTIFKKLNVSRRLEASLLAIRSGLV